MRLLGYLVCLSISLSTLALAAPARAQEAAAGSSKADRDAKARQLFEAGRIAYEEGLFDNAVENFRAAYKLSGRTALLYNLGMAAERARLDEEALQAFETYLANNPSAQNRGYVEQRIAFLREAIAEREAKAAADAEAARAEAAAEDEPTPQAAPTAALAPDPEYQGPSDTAEDKGLLSKWWFWTAVGVGAAAITTGIILATSGEDDPIRGDIGGTITTLQVQP